MKRSGLGAMTELRNVEQEIDQFRVRLIVAALVALGIVIGGVWLLRSRTAPATAQVDPKLIEKLGHLTDQDYRDVLAAIGSRFDKKAKYQSLFLAISRKLVMC